MHELVVEAAKFLRDAEKHAMEKVMATVKEGNSTIQFGGVAFDRSSNIRPCFEWKIQVYLNGEMFTITKEVESFSLYDEKQIEELVTASIVEKLTEFIRPHVVAKIKTPRQ